MHLPEVAQQMVRVTSVRLRRVAHLAQLEDLREVSLLAPAGGAVPERESTRPSRAGPREAEGESSGCRSRTTV